MMHSVPRKIIKLNGYKARVNMYGESEQVDEEDRDVHCSMHSFHHAFFQYFCCASFDILFIVIVCL